MTILKAHFDGRVLVPDEPVDLPLNCALEVQVKPLDSAASTSQPLRKLAEVARQFPVTGGPPDGAAQHDHYLYGLPKRS